eukprot:469802_1
MIMTKMRVWRILVVIVIMFINGSVAIVPPICKTNFKKNKPSPVFHNTACGRAIGALPKGNKPDPTEIYPKEEIIKFLHVFHTHPVSYLAPLSALNWFTFRHTPLPNLIGHDQGTFFTTKDKIDEILKNAVNAVRPKKQASDDPDFYKWVEEKMGIGRDKWVHSAGTHDDTIIQVVFPPIHVVADADDEGFTTKQYKAMNLRMVSGNEPLADADHWIVGGYLPVSVSKKKEAVVNGFPIVKARFWIVYKNHKFLPKPERFIPGMSAMIEYEDYDEYDQYDQYNQQAALSTGNEYYLLFIGLGIAFQVLIAVCLCMICFIMGGIGGYLFARKSNNKPHADYQEV